MQRLCPKSLRAHPHQGFLCPLHQLSERPQNGGDTQGKPLLAALYAADARSTGEEPRLQNLTVPRTPLPLATASPAGGITSLAGEDRAAHLPRWSTGTGQAAEPRGLWPRVSRGPMPRIRLQRGRAARLPARLLLQPGPAQPCLAPPALREPESPAGRGRAPAGWGSGCLRPPPLPRTPAGTAAKPGGGSWDGNQGALLLQGDVGEKDVPRCLALLAGEIFGVRNTMAFSLWILWASSRPEYHPQNQPQGDRHRPENQPPRAEHGSPQTAPWGTPTKLLQLFQEPIYLEIPSLTPGCSGMAVGKKPPKAKALEFLNMRAIPEVPQYPSGQG